VVIVLRARQAVVQSAMGKAGKAGAAAKAVVAKKGGAGKKGKAPKPEDMDVVATEGPADVKPKKAKGGKGEYTTVLFNP
jgi:hypothetical protein